MDTWGGQMKLRHTRKKERTTLLKKMQGPSKREERNKITWNNEKRPFKDKKKGKGSSRGTGTGKTAIIPGWGNLTIRKTTCD